jgi:hypothetical protein
MCSLPVTVSRFASICRSLPCGRTCQWSKGFATMLPVVLADVSSGMRGRKTRTVSHSCTLRPWDDALEADCRRTRALCGNPGVGKRGQCQRACPESHVSGSAAPGRAEEVEVVPFLDSVFAVRWAGAAKASAVSGQAPRPCATNARPNVMLRTVAEHRIRGRARGVQRGASPEFAAPR